MARILLADDEDVTREFAMRALAADGHLVVTAENGATALKTLMAQPTGFDLLLTDVQMPEMDGLSLAEAAIAVAPKLAVVLMSAYAEGFKAAERLKPHLKAVIAKPLTREDLKTAVSAALAAR